MQNNTMNKKTTSLPSEEEVVKQFRTRWGRFYLQRDIGSTEEPIVDWKQGESTTIGSDDIEKYFTQDRNQAYTRLVEGIDGMTYAVNVEEYLELFEKWEGKDYDQPFDDGYAQALKDIREKVVKPLYGKE